MSSVPLVGGDVFLHIQAGAGGFGDPLERDPERVRADVVDELITADYAADVYGVELTGGMVDTDATARRRAALRAGEVRCPDHLDHFHRVVGIPRKRA
jgi:N-methylhydantoinase B